MLLCIGVWWEVGVERTTREGNDFTKPRNELTVIVISDKVSLVVEGLDRTSRLESLSARCFLKLVDSWV